MGKLRDSDLFEPISLDMNEFSVMLIPLVQLFVPGINRRQVVVSSRLRGDSRDMTFRISADA